MMKLPALLLFTFATASLAQSVEQVAPTSADLARELGISLQKFSAKFNQPVYATFEIKIKVEGEDDVTSMTQTTTDPLKEHEFTFSLKDMDVLAASLGVAKTSQAKGAVDVSIKHPLVGFTQRLKNPFWQKKLGYTFLNWATPSAVDKIELEKSIPLVIQGGPYPDEEHQPRDLKADYEASPAFIWVGVKFTKLKPVEEEPSADKK